MMNDISSCKICRNTENNKSIIVKEMIRGTRDKFNYLECGNCGCLQLMDDNIDFVKYYDNKIYSSFHVVKKSKLKNFLSQKRRQYIFFKKGFLGFLLNKKFPLPPDYAIISEYANVNSKILDVGCGVGNYINDLSEIGFKNLKGIDPFLNEDIIYPNGIIVSKKFLEQENDTYDIIYSHHSFEHIPNPLETLVSVKERLNPNGVCIITIPISGDLYKEYRENCHIIQAPQHFFMHTVKSVKILSEMAGLKLEKIVRDNTNYLSWTKISELWSKDITCNLANNEWEKIFDSCLNEDEKKEFKKKCARLIIGEGDNATFILRN